MASTLPLAGGVLLLWKPLLTCLNFVCVRDADTPWLSMTLLTHSSSWEFALLLILLLVVLLDGKP